MEKRITDRKRTELALRESEARVRAILDTAVDGIITIDDKGVIRSFNPAAERIFGYNAEEVLGQNVNMLQPEPHRCQHDAYILSYIKTGIAKVIGTGREVRGLRRDGTEFPMDLSVSEVLLDDRRLFTGILRDISDRKRTEKALQAAKEVAETANRTKSEFLASMSHEIRTPMNAIIGMAELLWESPLTPEQREYVQIFRSAGENLLSIINDILDISKVEAGKIELESVDFNLLDLVEKTCEIMSLRAHEKGLELACNIVPGVETHLRGDPTRLTQILTNLMGNAIKFTTRGEIVTEISMAGEPLRHRDTHRETAGGSPIDTAPSEIEIMISVRDTGMGIPAGKLTSIFDIFSQADASTTREFGGTGLGLTISKRLVEMMNGRMWVESKENQGSTFFFTAGFERQKVLRKPAEPTEPVSIRGLKALIIDDNSTNRMILNAMLTSWDLVVTEAEDGMAGLDALEKSIASKHPFDLLLLDCRMPKMDGFEVAERLKSATGRFATTIMMLTSDNRSGDIARAKSLGISDYLLKPVKKSDLEKAIRATLTQAGRTDSAPRAESEKDRMRPEDTGRILLVDDSEDNRLLIKAYLKKSAYRLDVAENGQIAVDRFTSVKYDLILMDMEMPVMDGYEATRHIRALEKREAIKETPILALTAHAMKEYEQKSLDAGCTAHLSKPIKKKQLLEAIGIHMSKPL